MSNHLLLKRSLRILRYIENFVKYSTAAAPKCKTKASLLISCKRSEYDHYLGTYYDKLEEVPLASKGWNHSKSKDDYFTILPIPKDAQEATYPFQEFGIDNNLIEALRSRNIKYATEFQSRAMQAIQKGNHAMLAAETGCGKTVSYLVPIVQRLLRNQEKNKQEPGFNSPKVVIIVPNRELAYQVGEMASALCFPVGLRSTTVVGGKIKKVMLNPTFEEIDILVATPGALGKLSTVGIYKLEHVETLVLDEADTLIDDSFIERLETLISRMSQAQLLLVSATLPKTLPDILVPYGDSMEQVISPRLHKPLLHITQKFMRITRSVKPANLLQITKVNKDPMLIFTNRNQTCKWLAMFLRENGIPCSNISGDMNSVLRLEQWNNFVSGETKILSATDIGSRGLNTIQVKHVLNYDFPIYAADYIHRIGRVGRLGSPDDCKVTNFVTSPAEISLVQQIELSIRRNHPLSNVDGNITNLIRSKILRKSRKSSGLS